MNEVVAFLLGVILGHIVCRFRYRVLISRCNFLKEKV